MAEKQRRDNLNTNISTMAALVPTVAGSSRRMDKISILRLTAAYLRTQYSEFFFLSHIINIITNIFVQNNVLDKTFVS